MSLTKGQIKARVRGLLRDEGYPAVAMEDALVRVIYDIGNSGPYRFQKNAANFTLSENVAYVDIGSGVQREIDVTYNPTGDGFSLIKINYEDGVAEGRFGTPGIPDVFAVLGSLLYLDPVPDATAAGKVIRVTYTTDLNVPNSDSEYITIIPSRYHAGLLVYGVLAEVAPATQISTASGYVAASFAYQRAFAQMVKMEKWDANIIPQIYRDNRWLKLSRFGNIGRVR